MKTRQFASHINHLLHSKLLHNTATLVTGNVVQIAIALATYPLLTRLYSPDDFGLVNVFMSIGGLLILLATAKYEDAILLPSSQNGAVATFQAGFCVTIFVTALCTISITLSPQIANYFNAPALSNWYFLMPVYVFAGALWRLMEKWLLRAKQFGRCARYPGYLSTSNAILKIGLAKVPNFTGALIISAVLSPIVALFGSLGKNIKTTIATLKHFSRRKICAAAKRYHNFPRYSLPRFTVNYLSNSLHIYVLAPFFSLTQIGWLTTAITISLTPINALLGALNNVLFQRTAEKINEKQTIKKFLFGIIGKIMLIVIPLFTALYFVLPELTQWLLGNQWAQAGQYLRYMLPWLTLMFFSSTLGFIPDIFRKQRLFMIIEMLAIAAKFGCLWLGIWQKSFDLALTGYFGIAAIKSLIDTICIWKMINKYELSIKH